ncbi:MAG: adenylyltransferase/cytidyltransferase family protein [Ekhidna sp.]|nr:adenylyltransferase/cytidyltransferase family protein [Ekhidna sp.]
MKICYTYVCADVFHYGHLRLLKQAKAAGDIHVCGLMTDRESINQLGFVVMNYEERKAILDSLDCVDEVMKQDSNDPTENLKKIHAEHPDVELILFQGHQNWNGMPGISYIQSIGGKVYVLTITTVYLVKKLVECFLKTCFRKMKARLNLLTLVRIITPIVYQQRQTIWPMIHKSNAGLYESILNVQANVQDELEAAINKVVGSFHKQEDFNDENQILIQRQTQNISMSGVVFTRKLESNTPYYSISYDVGTQTDSVTDGSINLKVDIFKYLEIDRVPAQWQNLIEAVRELESLLERLILDIEFAITTNQEVVIFQVRALAANSRFYTPNDDLIRRKIEELNTHYRTLTNNKVNGFQQTIYSDMAFWNPAEIIGDRSNYLDYSIYKFLILSEPWNDGLAEIGYGKVNESLIHLFGSKSYTNVNHSFYSLLPADLDEDLKVRLINTYCQKLKKNPFLHDKIEFDIVHNCFDLDQARFYSGLEELGFSIEDSHKLNESLRKLTEGIIQNFDKTRKRDLQLLAQLETKRISLESKMANGRSIGAIHELLTCCKKYGTTPFSRSARMAFIGKFLLERLVSACLISDDQYHALLNGIETVATEFERDIDLLYANDISMEQFLAKYGHLRPSTYDICQPTYKEYPQYLGKTGHHEMRNGSILKDQTISNDDLQAINKFLNDLNLDLSASQLFYFIKQSISLREKLKFEFTRSLSQALDAIVLIGEELGFERKELCHLDIYSIFGSAELDSFEIKNIWKNLIQARAADKQVYDLIPMSPLLFANNDFRIADYYINTPNYITESVIEGEAVDVDTLHREDYAKIKGRIVMIEKADPGYDWLFSRGVKGLITKFGGAASHMAIRCAEFGLPAAVGCGQILYDKARTSKNIQLNCKNKSINVIS